MRSFLVALFALLLSAGFLPAASAFALERTPYICWMQPAGTTACANLPHDYHIDGIKHPHCDREHACNLSTLDFKLTREAIRDLSCYTHTSTMRPFHMATLYDGHWHGPHHHFHRHQLRHYWDHGEHHCHVDG